MNLVRREPQPPAALPTAFDWDPFRTFRDLIRWDPFRELAPVFGPVEANTALFVPDIDVKETPEAYVFKADLPGIKEKDLEIAMTGNRLIITGKREEEKREERATYFRCERCYGSFTRSFTLPEGANLEKANAELKEGVLTVSVPKMPEVQPRKIQVEAVKPTV
jgi:HSP20 family protein